jgi:acyl-CoA synthetase (AMP-forming)/AMP-acid ligase II
MNIAELLTIPASMFPEQEIVRFEGRGMSYALLCEGVAGMAEVMRSAGVRPGDRVAAIQTNVPDMLEALYATASLGAVFVPLNFRARQDELGDMLKVAAPRVVLAGERYLETARDLAAEQPDGPIILALERDADLISGPLSPDEAAAAIAVEEVADEALAVLMFTSGTTAAARGVMLAHADLASFVFSTTEPADGSDRGAVLLAAPLHHVAGLSAALSATFAGRRIVLMRQFEAEEWLALVGQESVTHAFLVPTMLKRVLEHPAFLSTDLSTLRVLSYGAAPMPLSVIRRAIEMFPPTVQFINAFGQTETTSTVTMLGPDDHRLEGTPDEVEKRLRRLGSIGRPLPGVEIAIVDEEGRPLPAGEVGEIAIRSERVMRGYYGEQEATRAALQDGWLRTRDLGWTDEDGYIFLAGRKSDVIIRGGENIAPDEVELVLESHPAVEEAAVIGLPDEEWGERVAAVVVPRAGEQVTPEALVEYCRQRLASFKKPEQIIFADELPRSTLGKVLRKELRARFEARALAEG